MIELYPQIRMAHIALISTSGAIMALRYLLALAGQRWGNHFAIRMFAWFIDASVITAATMLLTIVPRELYANGWLWAKLLFVLAYFGLGHFGLAAKRSPRMRALSGVAAMGAFAIAYAMARAHDPLLGLV